jgi:hypothetical protein
MKKNLFIFLLLALCSCHSSENSRNRAELKQRLDEFMQSFRHLDAEKMINYIYPKVFTVIDKEELLRQMKESMAGSPKKNLDSVTVDKICPIFDVDKSSYCKIDFTIALTFPVNIAKDSLGNSTKTPKDSGIRHVIGEGGYPAPQITLMQTLLEGKFGKGNVKFERDAALFRVRATNRLVAVKDEFAKQWSFIMYDKRDPKSTKIFSQNVLDKLADDR